jgi:CubicO group peptidase (beta-lactamase class C family)
MKQQLVFLVLLFFLRNISFSQQSSSDGQHSKAENLNMLCHYLRKHQMFNGNILIAEKGKLVSECSIGYANLETRQPLTQNSVFELASVSKQFTAAGILALVEEGKICVEQLIEFILPDFPYLDITIRNLLTHTSGLPDYMDLFEQHWDRSKIATNKDVLEMLREYHPPVHFAPGEQWEYSNTGYVLLACIIEEVSGMPYADFMRQNVFEPAHLDQTLVYSRRFRPQNLPDYAYGYISDDTNGGYILPDSLPEMDYIWYLDGIQGDGCVNSTTHDLMKWCQVIQNKELIDGKWWDEALTPFVLENGDTTQYGFGLDITRDPVDGIIISHGGGWPGYRTSLTHYLNKDITIVYLCNMEPSGETQRQTIQAIKNIATGKPFEFPEVPEKKKLAHTDSGIDP